MGLLRTLLALLLHTLYHRPHHVAGLPLHLDGVGLVRVVQLQQALHPPDVRQGAPHQLHGVLLLLLLLLPATLLLATFRHDVSFPVGLLRQPAGPRLCGIRCFVESDGYYLPM
jgi:hypothetical protein